MLVITAQAQTQPQSCLLTTSRFVAEGDAILDKLTGLIWSRCNLPRFFDATRGRCEAGAYVTDEFDGALKAMPSLSRETGSSWRLPTLTELRVVFDNGCTQAERRQSPFGQWDSVPIWTASGGVDGKVRQVDPGGPNERPSFYAVTKGASTIVGVRVTVN